MSETKIVLSERDIPRQWYNIAADLSTPLRPPLHPGTGAGRARRSGAALPDGAHRAGSEHQALDRHSRGSAWIFIGCGGHAAFIGPRGWSRRWTRRRTSTTSTRASVPRAATSPTPPSRRRITTRRGHPAPGHGDGRGAVGQRACAGVPSVRPGMHGVHGARSATSRSRTADRMMHSVGRRGVRQPQHRTNAGRRDAGATIPIRRAASASPSARRWRTRRRTTTPNIRSGSVLNHVLLHQTVIGQEAKTQMELAGDEPDVVIGCCGGGSNFGGLAFPFLADKLAGQEVRALAVEPTACPTLTQGAMRVRLRRYRRADAVVEDVHAGARFRAAGHSRRRAALSRRFALGQPSVRTKA